MSLPMTIASMTDSYKSSHWRQYPKGTEKVYSYFESRGGMFDETVFFGLQYILQEYLQGEAITDDEVMLEKAFWDEHMGPGIFNTEGWMHIVAEHDGTLPVSIRAVPEGSVVPVRNVLMTVENTCDKCFWLTNWLETLLVQVWYPSTVATISRECKKKILEALEKTGDPSTINFKLHDFGFRGSTSPQSAGIGGAAHLVNFMGTDTVAGIKHAMKYYRAKVCGFSIPAAEHSTITSYGREHEAEAFENMLKQFSTGLVAVVSDSYDIYHACEKLWGEKFKDQILKRDGTLVVRPDSGDPATTLKKVLDILGDKFGFETNSKGYKVLPKQIRVIYGDGINVESIPQILFTVCTAGGWSADNVAFGMGAGLLQKCDRDTQEHAFKCSNVTVDGKDRPVWKAPVDQSSVRKHSKKGRLKLVKTDGRFQTVPQDFPGDDRLVEVFRDGLVMTRYNFDTVRENAKV